MRSKSVQSIGWVTLLGFGGLGIYLNVQINKQGLLDFFSHGIPIYYQFPLGLSYGLVSALAIIKIINIPFIKKDCDRYLRIFQDLNLTPFSCFFLSICAGVGEELFFRVALQPMMGIWITSVVFVAVHGYLNFMRPIFFYGFFMVFIVAGIGWIYEEYGFWAAASSHFIIDLVLFRYLIASAESLEADES